MRASARPISAVRIGVSLVALCASLTAHAQDAPPPAPDPAPPPTQEGDARSYPPEFFARFSPTTALDMLAQVPGFSIRGEDNRRGLGQATGNVLINGQRPSGKSNDAVTELSRISAADVVRIDIVDGATLDVPGLTGQVANVLVRAGGLSGTFAWNPQVRVRSGVVRLTDAEASLSGQLAGTRFTLAVENNAFVDANDGPERVTDAFGTLIDSRAEALRFRGNDPRISLSLKRAEAGGTLINVNGSVKRERRRVEEMSLRSGADQPDRERRLDETRRAGSYEVSGDVEFGLVGGRLKLIGLRKGEHQVFVQTVTEAARAALTGDRFDQTEDSAETIMRAEIRWSAGRADWQLSAEGALNSLDVANALASLDNAGVFQPVPLADGGRVEERRGEAIASYGRPLARGLTLQLSAGAELSRLSQSGPNGQVRQFLRPKGTATLAWTASPRLDATLSLKREVGQLDFGDFVASANISAGTANAGNPDLVPPQSWTLEAQATRRFGELGQATLRLFTQRITDIVDVVPIGADGQAPGNLPQASVSGFEFTGTLVTDPLGMAGGKIDANLQLQTSGLNDLVTGRRRAISDDRLGFVSVQARRDPPGSDWAYGAGYDRSSQRPGFRLDQLSRRTGGGNLGVFLENKDVRGLTVRASADNLLGADEVFQRTFFDRRRTGDPLFTERRVRQAGLILTLGISGRF